MTATTVVAATGNVPAQSATSHQSHLIYATNTGRWWVFWLDSAAATVVKTRVSSSSDLATCTWSDGTSSGGWVGAGSHNSIGYDLGVGYKSIGGVDVVHLIAERTSGGSSFHSRVRATITAATTISWSAWDDGVVYGSSETLQKPVAGAVGYSSDDHVVEVSNYLATTGNMNVISSTNTDSGASWTTGWPTMVELASANWYCNSSAVIPLGSTNVMALSEDGNADPQMSDVTFAISAGTTWTTASGAAVYGSSSSQQPHDWGVIGRTTSDVHIVRRTSSTTFVHRRYNGTNWTTVAGDAIPTSGLTGHLANSGVALATDGTDVWLFILDTDANNTIRWSRWISGIGWSAWADLATDNTAKLCLAVQQQAASGQIGVLWTEGSASAYGLFQGVLVLTTPVSATAELSALATLSATATTNQYLYPITDVANVGEWTDEVASAIDLHTPLTYDDHSHYDRSPPTPANATFVVRLVDAERPGAGARTLHYQYGKNIDVGQIDITVELMQGESVIQTFTHTDVAEGWTAAVSTVTNPITDWDTPFDLRFTANQP